MKRREKRLALWAVVGIGLAAWFFVAWHEAKGFGLWATVALLACCLWKALLTRINRP